MTERKCVIIDDPQKCDEVGIYERNGENWIQVDTITSKYYCDLVEWFQRHFPKEGQRD
jgi:hypothetical protein